MGMAVSKTLKPQTYGNTVFPQSGIAELQDLGPTMDADSACRIHQPQDGFPQRPCWDELTQSSVILFNKTAEFPGCWSGSIRMRGPLDPSAFLYNEPVISSFPSPQSGQF